MNSVTRMLCQKYTDLTDEEIEAECNKAGLNEGDEPPRASQRFLL